MKDSLVKCLLVFQVSSLTKEKQFLRKDNDDLHVLVLSDVDTNAGAGGGAVKPETIEVGSVGGEAANGGATSGGGGGSRDNQSVYSEHYWTPHYSITSHLTPQYHNNVNSEQLQVF